MGYQVISCVYKLKTGTTASRKLYLDLANDRAVAVYAIGLNHEEFHLFEGSEVSRLRHARALRGQDLEVIQRLRRKVVPSPVFDKKTEIEREELKAAFIGYGDRARHPYRFLTGQAERDPYAKAIADIKNEKAAAAKRERLGHYQDDELAGVF